MNLSVTMTSSVCAECHIPIMYPGLCQKANRSEVMCRAFRPMQCHSCEMWPSEGVREFRWFTDLVTFGKSTNLVNIPKGAHIMKRLSHSVNPKGHLGWKALTSSTIVTILGFTLIHVWVNTTILHWHPGLSSILNLLDWWLQHLVVQARIYSLKNVEKCLFFFFLFFFSIKESGTYFIYV